MGIVQEPQPTTLGNKIGADPDMSGRAIEQCMGGKGYQWITEKTSGQ
jgi:hypothetical protein